MERSNATRQAFNIIPVNELTKKAAIHEAGHAAAIYLGNKHKKLPPVAFQIFFENSSIKPNATDGESAARIEGGRLIHTLPDSIAVATYDFSLAQKVMYQRAFEADVINLLAGPLAEANYVALRDNESINPSLINVDTLHNYGGSFDLGIIYNYLACFTHDRLQCEIKMKELFLAAFHFVSNYSHWHAITTLAKHILAQSKAVLHYEEIIAVLDSSMQQLASRKIIYR